MANLTIENVDLSELELADAKYEDILVTFIGADTYVKGTILAQSEADPAKANLYVRAGVTDGNGVANLILGHELTATGAGDLPARVIRGGDVRFDKLVIHDTTPPDNTEVNLLQANNILARKVTDYSTLDNQ